MTSYVDAVNELNQNTNELRTMLCNVAANQKKLKYASSQFESFNRKFKETHSGEGTFDKNEMLALKGIITQITNLKSIIANNFTQQWAQNTIGATSNSLASDICGIIFKSNGEAKKIDPENASIFDPTNSNWLKYHLLDLQTIAMSFNNFLDKRKTEDQVSTAIKARLKSINKFIDEYKDQTIDFEGSAFSAIPIHYRNWKLNQSDFEKKEIIGTGASARVFKGIMKDTGNEVAIKQLKPKELKGSKFRSFQREVSILAMVDHPTILKFYGATDTFPYSIVTEWMGGGDLYKALKSHKLDSTQLTICALDIARGMNYLHQKMIVHRDLKSLNILLDKEGHSRICDLGFARVVEETSKDNIKTFVGTYYWMAPELLEDNPSYSPKIDVYSYGIMLWEMLTHKVPYNGEDPTKVIAKVYQSNARPHFPPDAEKVPGMKKLIEDCWERLPENRPTFKEIVERLAKGEAFYLDAKVDKVIEYAREVLASDDPDTLKTKNFLEENKKNPVTIEQFIETFKDMAIPQWYYDSCWELFQSFIPNDFSNTNCNLETLAKGLTIFLNTTKNLEALDVFKKFPENTLPEEIVNMFVDSLPSGDEKLDEYSCIIACNNSKAQDVVPRVLGATSFIVFNFITKNPDKLKYNIRYIKAITTRLLVPLDKANDIEEVNTSFKCLQSIISYLNKKETTSTDENEKKQLQSYINELFSDFYIGFIVSFVLNLDKSKFSKSSSKMKTILSNVYDYFKLMVENNIPFTTKQNVFNILLLPSQDKVDTIKEHLASSLESNKISASNFVHWLTDNPQKINVDLLIYLISKLKPHRELYKDIQSIIEAIKSKSKGKTKDSLKKLSAEFN